MKNIPYRQIHLDFHTSPYIDGVGARYNEEDFVSVLKNAHVNSINLFAKCHHGYYYYPTQVGMMHPELDFDLFGSQVKICRENNMRVIAYTCVAWNEKVAKEHPEWMCIDFQGVRGAKRPIDCDYVTWNSLCINQESYKQLLMKEIEEIYKNYKPDGFWIDIVTGRTCTCNDCVDEMFDMGLNPKDIRDVKKHDRYAEIKFCQEFSKYIKELDENLQVYYNSFPSELENGDDYSLSSKHKREYFDFMDIESLPSEEWGYSHFPIAINYLNHHSDTCLTMMNGKFHMAWGDFGSLRNLKALEYECYRAIANGARVCIGDQMHPSGQLDKTVYDRIGKIFKSIEEKEPYLVGLDKVSQVGVIIAESVCQDTDPHDSSHTQEGVYRVLTELHIPFDFIDFYDSLEKYKLLILPDEVVLSKDMADKLNQYVQLGGKLLVTGKSGVDETNDKFMIHRMPCEFNGKSKHTTRYVQLGDQFEQLPNMHHVMYEQGYTVSSTGEVLGYIVEPYFNRSFSKFCSHRQTPGKLEASKEPCIVKNEDIVYISSPLFTDYCKNGYKVHRDILDACITMLLKERLIVTNASSLTEFSVRENAEQYVIHTLNYVIEKKCKKLSTIENDFIAMDIEVAFRCEEPRSITHFNSGHTIDFSYEDGYASFIIPLLRGHDMIIIEK